MVASKPSRASANAVRLALRLQRSRVKLKELADPDAKPVKFASGLEACFEALWLSLWCESIHSNLNMGTEILKSSARPGTLISLNS